MCTIAGVNCQPSKNLFTQNCVSTGINNVLSFFSAKCMLVHIVICIIDAYILFICNILYQLDGGKHTNLCCAGCYIALGGVKM